MHVVLDGAGADEQTGADLGVREAVARELRDLRFLGGELVTGLARAFASRLADGEQLAFRARGERLGAHRREHLLGGAQLVTGVASAFVAPQPFAEEQVGTGQLEC